MIAEFGVCAAYIFVRVSMCEYECSKLLII
jgi:hypothetical protein